MTNRCKINVTIADKTLPIYFSNDGTANSPTQYDVERNNIYRFTITEMTTTLSVEVDVQPYTEYILQPDFGLNRNNLGDLIVEIDQNSQGKIEYSEAFNKYLAAYEKEVKKKLLPLYEQDGTDELIPDLNDVNQKDYYAIHVGGDGNIYSPETELWLMDSDGCRVLSNYANSTDNAGNESTECSSRLVMYFPFASPENGIYYRKDDDHDIRLQHHDNHSCIVMRPDGNKYFKEYFDEKGVAYDKPQYTPVESWEGHWNPDPDQLNTTPGIFFIKVNVVMNGSTMTVYQKCSDQGIRQNYYVNDNGEVVNIKIESTL